jgi:hypothetical protein
MSHNDNLLVSRVLLDTCLELGEDLFANFRSFLRMYIGQKIAKKFANKIFSQFLIAINIITVFSEILGYGRVVHTPMEGIRVVPCNQQKDCTFILEVGMPIGYLFNVRTYPIKNLIGLTFEGVSPKAGIKNGHLYIVFCCCLPVGAGFQEQLFDFSFEFVTVTRILRRYPMN